MIDLRSDTQTLPSPGMRAAMATAEVGDEQRREDPTVRALEARGATLLGQEEAVFVPTATMGNQIALQVLGPRGSELIVEANAHIMVAELGGAAFHSGLQTRPIRGERGRISVAALQHAVLRRDLHHIPPTSLVALENTHNAAGGAVWPPEELRATVEAARGLGLSVYLDGARLPNAAVACGVSWAELAGQFDAVTICFSKGLGCPFGALIAGSAPRMAQARIAKHRFGGAMRQAGILAAAALYALDHNVERLSDDHRRARELAEGWASRGLPVRLDEVETNFVLIDVGALDLTVDEGVELFARAGVGVSATVSPGVVRAVTHLDIDDVAIGAAIERGGSLTGLN
jgi:threonine aldolase